MTTYRDLLSAYGRATGQWRASVPIRGVDTGVASKLTAVALPLPGGLAAVAAALRTGLDTLINLSPKVRLA